MAQFTYMGTTIKNQNLIQEERDHEEEKDVGGWTILKWILER
jgi:hypothetical protein